MNRGRPQDVHDHAAQDWAALRELCRPMAALDDPNAVAWVRPEQIPQPARSLLVHERHMTLELGRHYGHPVTLRVLADLHQGSIYTRKVILQAGGPGPVEWGVARMDMDMLPPGVVEKVLIKSQPLGSILEGSGVMRGIVPRSYLRLEPGSPVLAMFDAAPAAAVFGRLATIYCDQQPAVQLLEITADPGGATS